MTGPQRHGHEAAAKPSQTADSPPPSAPKRPRSRPGKLHQEPKAVTWAREKAGLTKRALADQIGVSEQLMGEIESGWRSATPVNLSKIAEALKCPLVALEAKGSALPRKSPVRQVHAVAADTRDAVQFGGSMDIAEAQWLVWENKKAKGFNTNNVAVEFGLLNAEVGEAFTAWRKRLPDFGEALADVVVYTMALAEMNGVNLAAEVARKIEKNARRTYDRDENGVLTRKSGE